MLHDLIRVAAVLFLISAGMFIALLISRHFSDRRHNAQKEAIIRLREDILSALVSQGDDALDQTLTFPADGPRLSLLLDLFSAVGGIERERLAAACSRVRMVESIANLPLAREETRVEQCELAGQLGGPAATHLLLRHLDDTAWRVSLAAGIELARLDAMAPTELIDRLPLEARRSRRMEMLLHAYPSVEWGAVSMLQDDERLPPLLREAISRFATTAPAPQPLASEGSPVAGLEAAQ